MQQETEVSSSHQGSEAPAAQFTAAGSHNRHVNGHGGRAFPGQACRLHHSPDPHKISRQNGGAELFPDPCPTPQTVRKKMPFNQYVWG